MPYLGAMESELLRHLTKKRATVLYPFEKVKLPEAYRGMWKHDLEKCIGCAICARECPSGAIEMRPTDLTKNGQYPVNYLARCMFCAQCEESCPTGAIKLTPEYELADYDKKIIDSAAPNGIRYESEEQ
ncbi:MAG: 4Fe-4S binding protein [Candidatus Odinarchaeia archaeon]